MNVRLRTIVVLGAGLAGAAAFVAPTGMGVAGAAARPADRSSVVRCLPADLSAVLLLTPVGSSSSSLAGAVVLTDTSSAPCNLRGVPKVDAVGPTGQELVESQAPNFFRKVRAVTLRPASASARRPDAGSSITWSNWTCSKDSFALTVRFPGWKGSITVPWGTTTGYAGTPCSGGDATLYVGPAEPVAAPA